jgi:AcrR family transcriptional regulator
MDDRLTKSDWIEHGLRTLASDGANALKVGPMATKLKVSRGSFYWHFQDIGDFRSQVLRCWQERTTEQVIRDLETARAEPDRLKHLMRRAFVAKRGLERAIRSWATEDKNVAAIVAAVDPQGLLHRKNASHGGGGTPTGVASGSLHVLGISGPAHCHGPPAYIDPSGGLGRNQRAL